MIESGETVILDDLEQKEGVHRLTDKQTGFTTHSVLCVPIKDPELHEVVGAIEALNKLGDSGFNAEDASLLAEVAEQVQARVSRIYLNQEIYGLSEKVLTTASRVVGYMAAAVALLVAILVVVMFVWILVPVLD